MIGSGLKKFALENGMRVGGGVGYGNLRGFQTTLNEGNGFKQMVITTKFPDAAKLNALLTTINQIDMQREYRVLQLNFITDGVLVVFQDKPGTMKKIAAFTDWFFPLLKEAEAYGADICPSCGLAMGGTGVWKKTDGMARCYHSACAAKLAAEIAADVGENRDTGTYAGGVVGAFLGALLGAVVWGLVILAGYITSLVGLLIGFLADKGYDLLKGKQGKGKVVILILAVIVGVAAGTCFGELMAIVQDLNSGELGQLGLTTKDIPRIIEVLLDDPEYIPAVMQNFLTGLFFAGLGVVALLVRAGKSVSKPKMTDLN